MDRGSSNDGFDYDHGHGRGGRGEPPSAAAGGEGADRPAEAAAAAGDDTGDGDERGGDGGDGDEVGGGKVEAGKLARLIEAVGIAERHVAEAVVLAGEVADLGVAERVEGQSLELVLATACRLTGADRKTLITAGQVLADMPCLRGLFETGEVAWGVVRLATVATKRLSRDARQAVDGRLAATVAERGTAGAFEPDELAEAIRAAADDQRDLATAQRDERDGVAHSFLAVQRDLFGGSRWYGELDATLTATAISALDAASRPPHRDEPPTDRDHNDGDRDEGDGGGEGDGEATAAVMGRAARNRVDPRVAGARLRRGVGSAVWRMAGRPPRQPRRRPR